MLLSLSVNHYIAEVLGREEAKRRVREIKEEKKGGKTGRREGKQMMTGGETKRGVKGERSKQDMRAGEDEREAKT